VLTLEDRPFFGHMLEGVEHALDGSGYRPLVASMRARGRSRKGTPDVLNVDTVLRVI
jgi:DNA-binding LacI/PurR family transcriptional regulator